MTELAEWLQHQMQIHDLTQAQLAVYAGLAQATISDILRKGHIPPVETLFRLADYFDTDRVEVLILSGYLGPADQYDPHPGRGGSRRGAGTRHSRTGSARGPRHWHQLAGDDSIYGNHHGAAIPAAACPALTPKDTACARI